MDGDIKVESEEGVGTQFTFHFFVDPALSNILGKRSGTESEQNKIHSDSTQDQLDQVLVEQRK